jgi:peptidoglycan/xylan/chitin deacetylase (PgdA/CDA1 family)
MYHRLQDVRKTSQDPILLDLSVPPDAVAAHVAMVKSLGAESVTIGDLVDFLYGRKVSPARPVAFTFDDGYDNTYTVAYPVLRAAGMRATLFVITDLVDQPGYVTWSQIRELSSAGWEIDSHTLTHPDLRALSNAELVHQRQQSKRELEQQTGRPLRYFSYPSGQYDNRVISAVGTAGYRAAVTVNYGMHFTLKDLFELTRVRIHGADDAATARARLLPATWR